MKCKIDEILNGIDWVRIERSEKINKTNKLIRVFLRSINFDAVFRRLLALVWWKHADRKTCYFIKTQKSVFNFILSSGFFNDVTTFNDIK